MFRRVLTVSFLAAAGLLAACGGDEEGIVLEIDSTLAIPSEVDALDVGVFSVDGLTKIKSEGYPLTDGQHFPLDIALVPSAATPPTLMIRVTGFLDEATVAVQEVVIEWKRGSIAYAKVELIP